MGRSVPIVASALGFEAGRGVDDRGNDPRNAEAKVDIDGVGARDVADGVVGSLVADGSRLGGEGIGEGGAESDESNSSDDKVIPRIKNK